MANSHGLVLKRCPLPDPNPGFANADRDLSGNIVLAVPHPDDESLGCGAVLSQISDKDRVRFLFMSDGATPPHLPTPSPVSPGEVSLRELRRKEALCAIHELGYTPSAAQFLDLPDGRLSVHQAAMTSALRAVCDRHLAVILLAPSRFDAHPDHLAVYRAAAAVAAGGDRPILLCEYFIYYRSRLLPGGDVRHYLRPECRLSFHSDVEMRAKRRAIDCHHTQRTKFFPWQTRPVLTDTVVESTIASPEVICRPVTGARSKRPLRLPSDMVSITQSLEFRLKSAKDALRQRTRRSGSAAAQ